MEEEFLKAYFMVAGILSKNPFSGIHKSQLRTIKNKSLKLVIDQKY